MLIPRQDVPNLTLPTVNHGTFDLKNNGADVFTLVVFYRGLHCPICAKYLMELGRLQSDFEAKGVKLVAISSDGQERAKEMAEKVNMPNLTFAYDLPLALAKDWGLYISESKGKTSIGIEEPAKFSEPGVFLIRNDLTLYYGSTQTMPFARPAFGDLLAAVDFAISKNYPARGEYTGNL